MKYGLLFLASGALAHLAFTKEDHIRDRQKLIDEINATPGVLWTAKMPNRFKGLPVGASKPMLGAKKPDPAVIEAAIKSGFAVRGPKNATIDLPDSFDSVENWPDCADVIGEIRDQSNCGCCWAFGAAEAASDRMCIASKAQLKMPLSSQDMCFCAERNGCGGGQLYTAWERIKRSGLVTGGMYNDTGAMGGGWCSKFSLPHCHHHGPQGNDPYPAENTRGCPSVRVSPSCPKRCDRDAKSPHDDFDSDKYSFSGTVMIHSSNADAIRQAIYEDGPVEAAFTVYSDFENYSGGIYHHTKGSMLGGHAIRIVGWGEENGVPFWKVANSWNPYWGENGYFRIVRGRDECGIEDDVVSSGKGARWSKMK